MIFSMTGFGKSSVDFQQKKITVEVKSLNSKQLDLSLRLPLAYREKELELRSEVAKSLERGKIDLFVTVSTVHGTEPINVNMPLLQEYKLILNNIGTELGLEQPNDWYSLLLRLPNVFSADANEVLSDEESELINKVVEDAVSRLNEFRKQEGARLDTFFREKIERLTQLLSEIDPYEKERVELIKSRIEDSMAKVGVNDYDKNRFEQELIYYIEKLDVTEEKLRLHNHLHYFIETLNGPIGQGKKLGFIAQEMGREINTLGSKSNNAEMQKIVVKMKDELEQIKEQVLNVL